jgi:heme-degrading monooxygenase HmoA
MYARTSSWAGTPEQLEHWARHVAENVGPMVERLPGNAGAVFLLDREQGTGLTLTLWDSEDAALETDRSADASRDRTINATGVELLARGRYEVVARV